MFLNILTRVFLEPQVTPAGTYLFRLPPIFIKPCRLGGAIHQPHVASVKRNALCLLRPTWLLEQLESVIEKSEVIEIRDYYVRADGMEHRQIVKMVGNHFILGEKRSFFKNILAQSQDIF